MSDEMTIHNLMPAGQGNAPLPEIDLRKLFEDATRATPGPLPTLVNADGVFFLTLAPTDRLSIATTIERLIGMLDAMDGDEDLEETGDREPSLGWTANGPQSLSPDIRIDDDRELEVCDEPHDAADCGDDEPWLGTTEDIDQERRQQGGLPFCLDGEVDFTIPSGEDFKFEGAGHGLAKQMMRGHGIDAYVRASAGLSTRKFVERSHRMPDGTVMRTFVVEREARPC